MKFWTSNTSGGEVSSFSILRVRGRGKERQKIAGNGKKVFIKPAIFS
jgi:hypothetical protein